MWVFLGALVLSGTTWLFAQTSLARQRLGQVTVFLTAGQVIMLMQLMAALKNLDFQWTGAPEKFLFVEASKTSRFVVCCGVQ